MIRKVKKKIGLRVKIVAKVGDQRSREIYEGFTEVSIDEPRVQLNFVGADTKVIDAEMPYDTLVMDPFQAGAECKLDHSRWLPPCRTAPNYLGRHFPRLSWKFGQHLSYTMVQRLI